MATKHKSIISNDRKCVFCNTTEGLHKHHIFFGNGRRGLSEQYGCWCYLCAKHHNLSNISVHMNEVMDRSLKEVAQVKWEERYGTREEFIRIFGRNYL